MITTKQVLTLVIFSIVLVACQVPESLKPKSPHNFNTLTENLVTGGQPSLTELKELKNAGVMKVINLRGPDEDVPFNEQAEAQALGLEYVSLPISGAADITSENARMLHELLAGQEKVFLHCGSGNRVSWRFAHMRLKANPSISRCNSGAPQAWDPWEGK